MSPAPAVPVAFVKYYEKGSTLMGGDQIAEGLRRRGWQAEGIRAHELGAQRRGVLVFIKTSRLDHLLLARARGHRLALDVQDTVVFKRRIKNKWLFDALILKNRRQLEDFGRRDRPDQVIYHQWDPRYSPNEAPRDRLVVGYLGLQRSLDLWQRLPEVECVDDQYFDVARRFNCHLSIRRPGREVLYKPNCKISTAAACDAVLITTRDESSVELLGADYPFYCEPDEASVVATIARARAGVGGPEWSLALARLRAVRELTHLERVLDRYEALLGELARPLVAPAAGQRAAASRA